MRFPEDDNFGILGRALDGADWDTALIAVHTLKGVAQNLGFDRLYAVSVPLTEAMRGGKPLTNPALLTAVKDVHQETVAAILQLDA